MNSFISIRISAPPPNCSAGDGFPIRPQTDAALAIAIMYVWVVEGLYDKDYVATRTTGFDEWKAYLLGETDGVPKTPEWQEAETGVPAKDARALARKWGGRKVHLAIGMTGAGFGGAGRGATGQQWARSMIMIMAMQGWGKPGVNFGSLQMGAPIDPYFYFPGYADGGISGDLLWTGNAVHNYQRMPHVLTMNHVKQMVPKQQLPDAIINGHATGYLWDGMSPGSAIRAVHLPHARLFADPHDLSLWRIGVQHRDQIGPMGGGLPARKHRIRGQPVDLDGRRSAVRRRHPAGLHVIGALGHRRMVQCRRLCGAWLLRPQSSRRHPAAQVHRAPGRIAIRL